MAVKLSLKAAALLFKYAYFLYKPLYFRFKQRQDARELQTMKGFVKEGDTVIDIGANIGFYTGFFSDWTGTGGSVLAFEPDRDNFSRLEKTCAGRNNVKLFNTAIGSASGTLTLYVSDLLNVDHRTYEPEHYAEKYEVPVTMLDTVLEKEGLRADFIKMDIQGYEYFALQGMRRTIAANSNIILFSEFWPYGLQQAGNTVEQWDVLLKELGLHIWLVTDTGLQPLSDLSTFPYTVNFESYYNLVLSPRKTL